MGSFRGDSQCSQISRRRGDMRRELCVLRDDRAKGPGREERKKEKRFTAEKYRFNHAPERAGGSNKIPSRTSKRIKGECLLLEMGTDRASRGGSLHQQEAAEFVQGKKKDSKESQQLRRDGRPKVKIKDRILTRNKNANSFRENRQPQDKMVDKLPSES